MKLKSLRLFGFKTFADQTVVAFEPGITGIVGPNGSGKSNLVDAMRWVLGEHHPKALRSTKTEDVIFVGNDKRKPFGMAEVSLTFDNESGTLPIDFREVQITRRAYRAGESEFYINRTQVRMRDIVELLMGTGLGPGSTAIVSQGQIDAFLSEKPTERRGLFEETAGINKFLARKGESLRRLEQTEQNGIRISDLLSEITARIPELETQARRARRFRRASVRLRELEVLSYLRSTTSRRAEQTRLHAEAERLEAQRVGAAARTAALEAELSTQRTQFYALELELEERRGEATHARASLSELEAQLAALGARREALGAQSATISDDRERVAAERAALQASLADLDARIPPLASELEAHRVAEQVAHHELSEARAELDRIYGALREIEAAAAADAASEATRTANLQALSADLERFEREAQEARAESAAVAAEAERQAQALREADEAGVKLQRQASEAAERATAGDAAATASSEALQNAQSALREAASELAGAEARLHTIEELEANLEGHAAGTRAILEAHARGEHPGIVGVVSDLIQVDREYARALDIAFGASLSSIVTNTAEDAERAIGELNARELGRATFLPLDVLGSRTGRDASALPPVPGVVGYAHTLVRSKPEYAGIVAFLVGRMLIVESLAVGIALVRKHGFRDTIVTREGDQIAGGGAMSGGRYRRERAILSRRAQAESLRERIPVLREGLQQAESDVANRTAQNEAAIQERDAARAFHGDVMLAERDAASTSESLRRETQRLQTQHAAAAERAGQRETEAAATRRDIELRSLRGSDPDALGTERSRLEGELEAAREHIARAQEAERAVAARIGSARESVGALTAQRDAERSRVALLDADHERAALLRAQMSEELSGLGERVATTEAALAQAREIVLSADATSENVRAQRDAGSERALALESEVRSAQAAERAALGDGEGTRLRLAEIEAELGMLTASFAQNPASAEECAEIEQRYAKEEGEFTAEVARLRDELQRLSNVNLNAEEERAQLAERETFLREQLDDLAKARETLLESIRQIEATSQVQFNETFTLVKRAFEEMFPRLFPGGIAHMWQTNPDSLSETGIEISVQPPGKKMTSLAALSGGERAMTAASLIFALITVRPSPFYLLDEVDAALDDANVERFSQIVRELANAAQLVLVTHNKKTMELAERLIGVTMAEPGTSSIVAADLDRVQDEEPALAG